MRRVRDDTQELMTKPRDPEGGWAENGLRILARIIARKLSHEALHAQSAGQEMGIVQPPENPADTWGGPDEH